MKLTKTSRNTVRSILNMYIKNIFGFRSETKMHIGHFLTNLKTAGYCFEIIPRLIMDVLTVSLDIGAKNLHKSS